MTTSIRVATETDLEAILDLEQHTPNAAHWSRHQYERLRSEGVILLAEDLKAGEATKLAGFLCSSNVAGEWEIQNIVVARESLRRGIGTALLQHLISRAKAESVSRILLEVRESNVAALRLYEKNGFSENGRRRSYYHDPVEDAVLYELHLDQNRAPE